MSTWKKQNKSEMNKDEVCTFSIKWQAAFYDKNTQILICITNIIIGILEKQ